MNIISKEFLDWIQETNTRLWEGDTATPERERALAHMAKLTEEMGELSEQVLASLGHQRKSKRSVDVKKNLAEEIADVIIVTILLAEDFSISIEPALRAKMKKIESRYKENDLK